MLGYNRCYSTSAHQGIILNGVLFRQQEKKEADTIMICLTGIHGNFYSNPFYYDIGDTLSSHGIDFIYAQSNDAFGQIETENIKTGKKELIGYWNERFFYADEDIEAWLDFAKAQGFRHIILAGHSLGANKVIYDLCRHHDPAIEHFFLLSPANLGYMMSNVIEKEKQWVLDQISPGRGDQLLPFPFKGWVHCIASSAYDWQFSGLLNNVHSAKNADFSQAEKISQTGAMLVGIYDNFTDGDPVEFLENLNTHMPTASENKLIFIEKTGHTYQMKHQQVAEAIFHQLQEWKREREHTASL